MISFSYLALNSAGDSTYANVHVNNKRYEETINAAYFTSGGSGQVASTGVDPTARPPALGAVGVGAQ